MNRHDLTSIVTFLAVSLLLTVVGCEGAPTLIPESTPTSEPSATATVRPTVTTAASAVTPSPSPTPQPATAQERARAFLDAWQERSYRDMYEMLSAGARAEISEERFVQRYEGIAAEVTLTDLETEVASVEESEDSAAAHFRATLQTILVGQVDQENVVPLVREGGEWRVDWSPQLIFPQLGADQLIHLFYQLPSRGQIVDRQGQILATQGSLTTVGVVPGQIVDEEQLLATLSEVLEMEPEAIKARYENALREDWFMPIQDLTAEQFRGHEGKLQSLPGAVLRDKEIRSYPYNQLGSHVLGYVGEINAEELQAMAPRGYLAGDRIGKVGLERWGEEYLAGRKGGILTVIDGEGQVQMTIQERPAAPGRDLRTTLDLNLQRAAEEALADRVGAVVVLDPRDGGVLAMASHPAFDPNRLSRGMSGEEWAELLSNPGRPLVNRVTQSVYPPASVFKIVTMAAGLEMGGLASDTPYQCEGVWYGLGEDWPKYDWVEEGHGEITLSQGMVESCDIVFYEIGKQLYELDRSALPGFARKFGLGQPTGLEALEEAAGSVPGPEGERWLLGDAVNVAIGQGDLLATPLQVANLIAAVANGGTLYEPYLVREVGRGLEQEAVTFEPGEIGALPLSAENLEILRASLRGVAADPGGTAHEALQGMALSVAGKTGTAEHAGETPHAWFAGYAPADDPQIAVAVIVEESGHGADVAAPVFRRIVEAFAGSGG